MIDMKKTFELLLLPYLDVETKTFDLNGFMSSKVVASFPDYHIKDIDLPCFVMTNKKETVAILVIVNESDKTDIDYSLSNYYFIATAVEGEEACDLLDMAYAHGIPIDNTTMGTMFARMICAIDGGGKIIDSTLIYSMDRWYMEHRFNVEEV